MECTNVLCDFANGFANTNIDVSYHYAVTSLLAEGSPSQVPTITIDAHVGTAVDLTSSAMEQYQPRQEGCEPPPLH